jgi:hypothetical protein
VTDLQAWLTADILSLGMAADDVRRQVAPDLVVTYSRVHTVSTAAMTSDSPIPDAASEVRIHELPATLDEAVGQIADLKARAGARPVVAYSWADIEERTRHGWGDSREVLARLAGAGLSDVAELPVDALESLEAAVRTLTAAGLPPRRVTVARPLGDRVTEILAHVWHCRERTGRPLTLAPLPRHGPPDKPTTGYEDLRLVALSRLAVGGRDTPAGPLSIEVDWSLFGPKLAQVALTFGADHLDAVPATSDDALGARRGTVEDVERNIRAAGFSPRENRRG